MQAVLLDCLGRGLGIHFAATCQHLQGPHHDGVDVVLEEAAGCGAGVGEAEAVGSERGELVREELADLVRDGLHVVGDRHNRAGGAGELFGDERDAGGLAGVGGLLFLLQFNIRYDTGFELGLIAFTAAVLGGIGNLSGAVLGAVTIGLIQAFNEGLSWYTPGSDWTRSIIFGLLIAILVFRPQGILGEQTPDRA